MKCPRGCGREIIWFQDERGRKVALDAHASVYLVRTIAGDKLAQQVRDSAYRVFHFSICAAPSTATLALWKDPPSHHAE